MLPLAINKMGRETFCCDGEGSQLCLDHPYIERDTLPTETSATPMAEDAKRDDRS